MRVWACIVSRVRNRALATHTQGACSCGERPPMCGVAVGGGRCEKSCRSRFIYTGPPRPSPVQLETVACGVDRHANCPAPAKGRSARPVGGGDVSKFAAPCYPWARVHPCSTE